MDSSHLVRGYLNDLSCCSERQNTLLPPTEKPSSLPSGSGSSVHILNVFDYECLNCKETHRATPDSLYTLDDYSIDHLPAVDIFLSIPESIPPIQSDQFIPGWSSVPEYPAFPACADSTSTDNRQMSRLPLCSTATVEEFNKVTQQQVPTETATLTAIESFGSSIPQEGVHDLRISNSRQTECFTSLRSRMTKAKYNNSANGRRTEANYLSIDKKKMSQARRQAKFRASAKGRMSRAKSNARYHAYSKAKMEGFSEELAREKGEAAAKERERRYLIESPQTFQSNSR